MHVQHCLWCASTVCVTAPWFMICGIAAIAGSEGYAITNRGCVMDVLAVARRTSTINLLTLSIRLSVYIYIYIYIYPLLPVRNSNSVDAVSLAPRRSNAVCVCAAVSSGEHFFGPTCLPST